MRTQAREVVMIPAGYGRRIGAFLIDTAIAAVLAGAVTAVMFGVGLWLSELTVGGQSMLFTASSGLATIPAALAWLLILSAMQGGQGSPGQRSVRIGLRDTEGRRIGFDRSLGRNIVFWLLSLAVIGFFTPFFDRSGRRQGWHDKVGSAVMVDLRDADLDDTSG